MTGTRRACTWMLVAAACVACDPESPKPTRPNAPVPAHRAPALDEDLIARIEAAEYRRQATTVPADAIAHIDPAMRRRAARALARIASPSALETLRPMLADEDTVVVGWVAYGLGFACRGREEETVRALVTRAASLAATRPTTPPKPGRFTIDPIASIAGALGRCRTTDAERTLTAWAAGDPRFAEGALRALSQLASRRTKLEDATLVTLVKLASGTGPLRAAALGVLGNTRLDPATAAATLEAATAVIEAGGAGVIHAVDAAKACGAKGAPILGKLARSSEARPEERAKAARALGDLDLDGQAELREVLLSFGWEGKAEPSAVLDGYLPLLATLRALTPPAPGVTRELVALAELGIPPDAEAPIVRRLSHVRCTAAAILAGSASLSERLVQCDPTDGITEALAVLEVLARGELTGARATRWRELASHDHPAVAAAAIEMVEGHPELPKLPLALARALVHEAPGVVAEAARVIENHPETVTLDEPGTEDDKSSRRIAPEVLEALGKALDRERPPDQIETRGLLLRAAARLGLLSVKARAEHDCQIDNPTVRRHAELALATLATGGARCPPAKPSSEAVDIEMGEDPVALTFITDHGRLGITLEPSIAPLATARLLKLAESGFFDGMPVHRVVVGRVVQFGDPMGDGYGGAGLEPIPSETSPLPFDALSVGMALSGRDTGSSQLFVTLVPAPELDGQYPLIGYADLEWRDVARGDVILKVVIND